MRHQVRAAQVEDERRGVLAADRERGSSVVRGQRARQQRPGALRGDQLARARHLQTRRGLRRVFLGSAAYLRPSNSAGLRAPSVASYVRDDARSSRDTCVGSLESPSRSEKIGALVVVLARAARTRTAPRTRDARTTGQNPSPFAFTPRARSQHDRRRPPRQGASAPGRRETRGARLLRDPAHLMAASHRRVPPIPRVAHRRAHRTVRPVARATMRAERARTRHAREGCFFARRARLGFFYPHLTGGSDLSRPTPPPIASLDTHARSTRARARKVPSG